MSRAVKCQAFFLCPGANRFQTVSNYMVLTEKAPTIRVTHHRGAGYFVLCLCVSFSATPSCASRILAGEIPDNRRPWRYLSENLL